MTSIASNNPLESSGEQKNEEQVRSPAVILFEYVGDRSGSTSSISTAQMIGLQKCMCDRRVDMERTGAECYASITTFDDEVETFTKKWSENDDDYANLKNMPEKFTSEELNNMLKPRGCTRLVDTAYERALAFEKKMNEIHESLKDKENKKVVGVFAISTDGLDNASCKYSVQELNAVVRRLRKSGVEMMFLAANQDAIATGTTFGFAASHAMTFGATPETAKAAFKGLSQLTRDASDGVPTPGFSRRMRQASAPMSNSSPVFGSQRVVIPRRLNMSTCTPPPDPFGAAHLAAGLTPQQQYHMNISGATRVRLVRSPRVTFDD